MVRTCNPSKSDKYCYEVFQPDAKEIKINVILDAANAKLWTSLKSKFQYTNDCLFIIFLLELAKRELKPPRTRQWKKSVVEEFHVDKQDAPKRKLGFGHEYRRCFKKRRRRMLSARFKSFKTSTQKSLTDVSEYSTDENDEYWPKGPSECAIKNNQTLCHEPERFEKVSRLRGFLRRDYFPTKQVPNSLTPEKMMMYEDGWGEASSPSGLPDDTFLQEFSNAIVYDSPQFQNDQHGKADSEQYLNSLSEGVPDQGILDPFDPGDGIDNEVLNYSDNHRFAPSADVIANFACHTDAPFTPAAEDLPDFVSPSLTRFASDPNLNTAFAQLSGKIANLISADESMLNSFEHNIDQSTQFSQAVTSDHEYSTKDCPEATTHSDLFAHNSSFLAYNGKDDKQIDFDVQQQRFVETNHPEFFNATDLAPLPRFCEETEGKSRFGMIRGKPRSFTENHAKDLETLSDSSESRNYPANDINFGDQKSRKSDLRSKADKKHFSENKEMRVKEGSVVNETDSNSTDCRGLESRINKELVNSDEQDNSCVEDLEPSLGNCFEDGDASSESCVAEKNYVDPTGCEKKGSVKPFAHQRYPEYKHNSRLKKFHFSDGKKIKMGVDDACDNGALSPPPCSSDEGQDRPDTRTPPLDYSINREDDTSKDSKAIVQSQENFLPRFLGKTGSELMSVKFKRHLLAGSLLSCRDDVASKTELECSSIDIETPVENLRDLSLPKTEKDETPSADKYNASVDNEVRPSEGGNCADNKVDVRGENMVEGNDEVVYEEALGMEFCLRIVDPHHGVSVFANSNIPQGIEIGPVQGVLLKESDILDDSDMRHIWQLGEDGEYGYLNTEDSESSNWMRHIRPARSRRQAKTVTTVKENQLYFRCIIDILIGEEITYWVPDTSSKWARKRLDKTQCGGCNMEFKHMLYYRLHCMVFHDPAFTLSIRKFYCKICFVAVIGKDKIVAHAQEAHDGKGAYQCKFCKKFFLRLKYLETHRNFGCALNPERSKPTCDVCGKTFCQPQKLQNHKKRMHRDMEEVLKDFQCDVCKKVLGSGAAISRHKKEVHGKDQISETCQFCSKVFTNKSNLKIHLLTHSGIKPFRCQMEGCQLGYTTKQCLQKHYKKAHGLSKDGIPKIERNVAFTFDAYTGGKIKEKDSIKPRKSAPLSDNENQTLGIESGDDDHSEATSPLSVGCGAELPPHSAPRPDEEDSDSVDDVDEGPPSTYDEDKKWIYRQDNSSGLLMEDTISVVEREIETKGDTVIELTYVPITLYQDGGLHRDLPKSATTAKETPKDYNISSLIRENLSDLNPTNNDSELTGKESLAVSRSQLYRNESRDDLNEYRSTELYRRDGYDLSISEVQNLSLKEKSFQLELAYKGYEGLDDLERIGRDPAVLDGLLVGESSRMAGMISPRYHPTYESESMDLSLPRIPYPSSPIYSTLDLQGRFELPSARLVDLRSHLGLPTHRFTSPRVVSGTDGSSSSAGFPVYQPTPYAVPPARLSPTPTFHPYSAYY